MKAMPPAASTRCISSRLRVGETTLMCSDGMSQGTPKFEGFSLTIVCRSDAEVSRLFDGIVTNGGKVQQPLTPTFFASSFGMATDRFGVSWMFIHRLSGD